MHKILYHLETRIKEPFYTWVKSAYNFILLKNNAEGTISNGSDFPNIVFYWIDMHETSIGLASYIDKVLGYMEHADRHGYVPVVGITAPENSIVDKEKGGNAWEYYFDGIRTGDKNYHLDDIQHAAHIVICSQQYISLHKRFSRKEIAHRNRNFIRIPYNRSVQERFSISERAILTGQKMIGVYYRGTDYRKRGDWNPAGHPKVLGIEMFMKRLQAYIQEVNCSRVFFVTEEQEALDYAEEFLRNRQVELHYIRKSRFSNFSYKASVSSQLPPSVSCYENNLLYLLDLDILSKCDFLFGPFCSGIQLALNMNGNRYEDVHILDIGRN